MTQQLLQTPLAIVGMACRLPGAGNLTEFWELLREGRDAITEMPPDRLDRSLYFHPEKGQRGKTYSTLGGFITDRPLTRASQLLTAAEFANADRCHQIFCDVALEACEHGGMNIHDFPLRNTGVYVGHSAGSNLGGEMSFATLAEETLDYLFDIPDFAQIGIPAARSVVRNTAQRLRRTRPRRQKNGGPDFEAHFGSALVARALGLQGPHFVIDAACASSLVALSAAALALNHGAIDAAIVGGASFNKGDSLILFSHAHSCSARGTCPFDSQADGLISSEGYVALVVKRLPRAIADGDTIHAVIRGLGISSDGRGRSLWAPRKEGQIEAIRRAYGPGLDPRNVQFIEAHATSTQVGDATELEALAEFFTPICAADNKKIPIGSVKSNIGHTLETAGLAGLLKTTLALKHAEIPPTVHVQQLHPGIPWDRLPFRVPTRSESWNPLNHGRSRCGAVNAFGIGGLNVHVVLEEYVPATAIPARSERIDGSQSAPSTPRRLAPIAIIGRGVILPGARCVADFAANLKSQRSMIQEAPENRWRKRIGVAVGEPNSWTSPLARGGYITDYAYDWKTNKIPPKQVAQANPLQFMLLDAAREALAESGYDKKPFESMSTAVVVGNVFGGEFGNHLTTGLRLPEIKRELCEELVASGLSKSQAESIAKALEERLLEVKPALLDETGSFTSSTLASRVAKSLNLMGGALALDAGDCSSLASLSLACDLLRSKANSLVFCAAAQRAMDLPAFESMALQRRLVGCAGAPDEGYVPGEGVALLLLKRLEDAARDGDRVLGVIESVAAGMDAVDLSRAVQLAGIKALESSQTPGSEIGNVLHGCGIRALDELERRALSESHVATTEVSAGRLIRQIGHTQAVHGLASVIQATIESPEQTSAICVHSSSGLAYHAVVSPATRIARKKSDPGKPAVSSGVAGPRIVRFSATSEPLLFKRLAEAARQISNTWSNPPAPFSSDAAIRLAVVANSATDLAEKIALMQNAGDLAKSQELLRERGVFFSARPGAGTRLTFVFPGQGSQYPGMLRETVQGSAAARQAMNKADGILAEFGFPSFADMAWHNTERLGIDVWTTQMAVLVADFIALATVRDLGLKPDCVVGHSFGEFAALVAAEAIDLRQAIKLTDERARAVENSIRPIYGMLSIKASLSTVESYVTEYEGRLFLSHHNSPEQIVLGGFAESLEQLESHLTWKNIATRRLQVPTAYHTPLMQPMMDAWTAALAREKILPPKILLLSSVTNKYVADPDEIRENLAAQLVTPVHYVQLLKRLVCDRMDGLIEVGPHQVLTQLHRRTLHDRGLVMTSVDHPKRSAAEQALRVVAELECLGWQRSATDVAEPRTARTDTFSTARVTHTTVPIEHFDATTVRKQRRRSETRSVPWAERIVEPVTAFDATQRRRSQNRQQDAPPINSRVPDESYVTTPTNLITSPTTEAEEPKSAALSDAAINVDQILIDFVVEHTGYPANLINFDWDMEADLGIDSIKRAQLFGELRDLFQLPATGGTSLDDYRTLRQIADLLRSRVGNGNHASVSTAPRIAGVPSNNDRTSKLPVATRTRSGTDQNSDGLPQVSEVLRLPLPAYAPQRTSREAASARATLSPSATQLISSPARLSPGSELSTDENEFRFQPSTQQTDATEVGRAAVRALASPRYQSGLQKGRQHAKSIRLQLHRLADRQNGNGHAATETRGASTAPIFTADDLSELQGIADGAGVHFENVLALQHATGSNTAANGIPQLEAEQPASAPTQRALTQRALIQRALIQRALIQRALIQRTLIQRTPIQRTSIQRTSIQRVLTQHEPEIAQRYVLRTIPSPQRTSADAQPKWIGAAVILGKNELAEKIRQQFVRDGGNAYVVESTDDPQECVRELDKIWQQEPAPHLFITTPRDPDAITTWSSDAFDRRRRRGVTAPFWFCQRWVKLAITSGIIDSASMVGILSLGGDFGFAAQPQSVESGAIAGLLKSIIIENWVAGFRTTPIKLIDAPPRASSHDLVDAVWRELAVPSFDCEIAWNGDERRVVRAIRQPADSPRTAVSRGGVWVCTGGARGITAYVAQELATRYGLKLHLLGLSPTPSGPYVGRTLSESELRQLKIEVMQAARERGASPVKEWDKVEKAFEIHRTLKKLRSLGVSAQYHACDVADRIALQAVLEKIRASDGPLQGVLHGAGVGKDARFDRKEPERVEQCIRAKIDGARALMELTNTDPLTHFVSFGSISGRFGANGHTDYSLANDMLCKLMDWYRGERPDVHGVGFHWHAWGDVGMAMKPETKLALEMVGMQFMPAAEGVEHLVTELEAESSETEVLITDDRYYRLFYPAETLAAEGIQPAPTATQLSLLGDATRENIDGQWTIAIQLDPTREPFLIEHRLDDRPLLPIVIGMELIAEAAVSFHGSGQVVRFSRVEALQGLKFFTDRPRTVRIRVTRVHESLVHCELVADFHARDGRLVEANRVYLRGDVQLGLERPNKSHRIEPLGQSDWNVVEYALQGSKFYLGSPLRRLKQIQLEPSRALGKILAPLLIELAGAHRRLESWIVPSAAIDACLYATGLLCWSQVSSGATLPVRFGAMELGRMPDPGEGCVVEVRFRGRDGRHAIFDFVLCGIDGNVLVQVTDYHIAWIGGS